MVRGYPRLWMIHHLAARPMAGQRVGIKILDQGFNFIDGLHRLPSVKMDYMMFFYRPTNTFIDYFFGDFSRAMDNRRVCSIDLFAYYPFAIDRDGGPLEPGIGLDPSSGPDLMALKAWYARLGLLRSCEPYSLRINGRLQAVIVVDRSDFGINLSEFLNNLKVFVLDEALPWPTLSSAVNRLAQVYSTPKVPLMVFPSAYMEAQPVELDRYYNLWILDARHADAFVAYSKGRSKTRVVQMLFRHYTRQLLQWQRRVLRVG